MPNGKLTTHILDTARGLPGAGIRIDLYACDPPSRHHLASFVSNDDGRCDQPLLLGEQLRVGRYELDFHVGDYFAGLGLPLPEPRFLDLITLRFGISDANAHYHVPLLLSPFGYSTYRGS